MKLVTFVYNGPIVPIFINQDSKLESTHIEFTRATFQDVSALLNGIPAMQNLTFKITLQRPEVCSSNGIIVVIKFVVNIIS
jgi:hypothetical protein